MDAIFTSAQLPASGAPPATLPRRLIVIALALVGCVGTGRIVTATRGDVDGPAASPVDGATPVPNDRDGPPTSTGGPPPSTDGPTTTTGGPPPAEDAGPPVSFDAAGCIQKGAPANTSQMPGTWKNVTPAGADLASTRGAGSVVVDPARPSDIYVGTDARGIYKSADYGATWKKIGTGANGNMLEAGPIWSMAIDPNPCRNPDTPATLYAVVIFGGGLWKSVDGGTNWSRSWDKNVTSAEGQDIWGDIGPDVGSIRTPDPADSNHLIVIMHAYFGMMGNTGIYESRDAGAHWVLRKSTKFSFQAHNDIFGIIDAKTWLVSPGTISTGTHLYRTTAGGEPWVDVGVAPARNLGYIMAVGGSTIYTGTDFTSGVWQTKDRGVTWQPVPNAGGHADVSWVVATASKIYAAAGVSTSIGGKPMQMTVQHMDIGSSAPWVSVQPAGMMDNGHLAAATFDGTHHVVIAAQHTAGIWRYVEP